MNSRRFPIGWLLAGLIGFGVGLLVTSQRAVGPAPTAVVTPPVVRPQPTPAPVPRENSTPATANTTRGNMPADVADALRRRSKGEYVRDSNIPTKRQQRDDHVRRAADYNMAQRDAEYADLYAALGLDAATSQQLRNHLREIYEAKVDALRGLGEVVDAQLEYDKRMKELLGENYATYRAIETAHSAKRAYEAYRSHTEKQGLAVVAAERAQIEKLIQGASAYSMSIESEWGSPYHSVPPPVGGENLKPFLLAKLEALQARAATLLNEARAVGLSATSVQALEAYYRAEIAVQQNQIARVENPDLSRQIMLQQQLESMKARPNANPRVVEILEKQLKSLRESQPPDRR